MKWTNSDGDRNQNENMVPYLAKESLYWLRVQSSWTMHADS